MAILIYLQLFASYFCSVLLFFLPGIISYKLFILALAIISLVTDFFYVLKNKQSISKNVIIAFFVSVIVVLAYKITSLIYGTYNALYESEFLVLVAQTIPAIFTISLISEDKKIIEEVKRKSIIIGILFSLVAFCVTIRPSGINSAGLVVNDETNLNYQSLSYIAAYSSGLLEFYVLCFSNKKIKKFAILLIVLNLVTIILAGGRGGFLCYLIFFFMSVYLSIRKNNGSLKTFNIFVIFTLIILVLASTFLRNVDIDNISSNSLARIIGMLKGQSDENRRELITKALASFKHSWLLGHGLGSVMYEVGFYSHNLFSDSLVETGIIGTMFCIFLLIYNFKKNITMIKTEYSDSIWLYLFLCGFIMSLFSGYSLVSVSLWIPLFFVVLKPNSKKYRLISR